MSLKGGGQERVGLGARVAVPIRAMGAVLRRSCSLYFQVVDGRKGAAFCLCLRRPAWASATFRMGGHSMHTGRGHTRVVHNFVSPNILQSDEQ